MSSFSACSIYKSEGRKNFENQSPGQIRSLSFEGCQTQAPLFANAKQLFTPNGKMVYVSVVQEQVLAQVPFDGSTQKMVCLYTSPNQAHWLSLKELFLSEVDALSMN